MNFDLWQVCSQCPVRGCVIVLCCDMDRRVVIPTQGRLSSHLISFGVTGRRAQDPRWGSLPTSFWDPRPLERHEFTEESVFSLFFWNDRGREWLNRGTEVPAFAQFGCDHRQGARGLDLGPHQAIGDSCSSLVCHACGAGTHPGLQCLFQNTCPSTSRGSLHPSS